MAEANKEKSEDSKDAVKKEDFQEKRDVAGAGGKNPLLLVLVILNTVVTGLIASMQWAAHTKKASEPDIKDVVRTEMQAQLQSEEKNTQNEVTGKAKEEDGLLFPLEPFTANLAQTDGPRRYVRLNTVLKFKKSSSEEEFKARQPQIRDSIISILNSKRPNDLLNAEGKEFLKEEIKSAINNFLVDSMVIDVYYVGFQIN
ncbi:MAG: flagellar basal body-associated FliL family protein [Bdellovibrio sp.]|nr:flagellar basal body-associated FliL family protein [Bdellovibrio sp.]